MRLLIIPGALVGVFFPAFSASFACDRERTASLFARATKIVLLTMFPLVLAVVAFAHVGLNLWLGPEFALKSTRVLQLLVAGIFFNSLGLVAFSLVQGIGRPDLTAKLHLTELAIYVPVVWWLIKTYGIAGAALGCATRLALDAIILLIMARRALSRSSRIFNREALLIATTALAFLVLAVPQTAPVQGALLLLFFAGFAVAAWFMILSPEERVMVIGSYRQGRFCFWFTR